MWFNNLKLGKKLIISFVAVALLTGVLGVFAILNLNTINKDYKDMYASDGSPLGDLGNIGIDFANNRTLVRDMIGADEQTIANNKEEIANADINFQMNLESFSKSIRTEENQAAYDNLVTLANNYIEFRDRVIELAEQGRAAEAEALMKENAHISDQMNDTIRTIFANKQSSGDFLVEQLSRQANTTILLLVGIAAVTMLLAIGLGMFISRTISRPVNQMVDVANQIANGNLDVAVEINTKDEIGMLGQAFSQMANQLNEVMINIRSAADQVASGSKQMSESSLLLSQGATEQASSVEQLTASLEEISENINHNAQLSVQSNQIAQLSRNNALEGDNHMKEMLVAMDDINMSSTSISKIIKVIDEIAFQTNILALNAAVEAARAGQHGKGFAVVAEEVRNLAARSANAAKETTELIESSILKVSDGMKIATNTAEALKQIVDNISQVADISGQISHASNEQAAGIEQINQGLAQVSTVIQTNSSTAEESAAASEQLSSQASMMREQIAKFRTKDLSGLTPQYQYQAYSNDLDEAFAKAANHLEPISISDKEFGKY